MVLLYMTSYTKGPKQKKQTFFLTTLLRLFSTSDSNTSSQLADDFELDLEVFYDTEKKIVDINIR